MKPTSQNFNRLLEARLPENILNALTICCWEALGNRGEPPPVTTRELLTCDKSLFEIRENISAETLIRELLLLYNQKISQSTDIEITRLKAHLSIDSLTRMSRDEIRNASNKLDDTEEQINLDNETSAIFQRVHDFFAAFAGLQITKDPLEAKEHIQLIHDIWMFARESNNKLQHPLAPIVRAWLKEQTAKRINAEYDRKHPTAVLKHPMGSIREVNFVTGEHAQLREFATPQRITQTEPLQLRLDFANDPPSILPGLMPLEVAHPMGLQATTKKGAVSHVVRVFFEALMALEPNQRQADLMFTLGDLISYLYPGYQREDGSYDHKAFNRTLQLPYIINALEILHFYATVPFDQGTSEPGYWRPVTVRTRLKPDAKNDAKIFLDVKLPPDATQGMMVQKAIMRLLGKQSAPKFNAYLTACWLLDKHGTTPQGLIDPTRPVEQRNDSGQLVDPQGNPIVTPRGKPVTSLYHPRAVAQLERKPNTEALPRYPVLSDKDLVLACFPNGYQPKRYKRDLERAKKYWGELEKEGIISLQRERQGWRIMPSESHLNAYRGLRKAIKKSKHR